MARKDNSSFNFGEDIDDSFNSDDLNSLDNNIDLSQLQHVHKRQDMDARHEIIKNIYFSLIKLTKPCVLIILIFIAVIVYPFSRIELPFSFGNLLMNYLKVFYELITACASFILGAIVSNWLSSKIDR